jgi:excisionase family DNA binding protein
MATLDKLIYTQVEASRLLGLSTRTVYRWIRAGKLYPVDVVGTRIYVTARALERHHKGTSSMLIPPPN